MTLQREITILIPLMRPPDVTSVDVKAINNIISKFKEKVKVKQIWIIFQNSKFKIQNSNDIKVIHFEDFKNAVEIIEKFQPTFILFDGELTIPSLVFALIGKRKEIPTIGTFFIPELGKREIRWIKNKIQMIFAKKAFTNTKIDFESDESIAIKFLFREYQFLFRTIIKLNFTILELIKFFINYPRVQLFSRYSIVHNKINEPTLTLCSTIFWKDKLKEIGFDKNNLKVIGTPLYDDLFNKTKDMKFEHSHSEKIRILFCTSSMHEHGIWSKKNEEKLIKNTINKLNERKDFQISLKIHPVTSSIKEYEKLIEKIGLNIKLYQKKNFDELKKEYDVVITYGASSIVHECVLLKKPIVSLQLINDSLTEVSYDESVIDICKDLNNIFDKINNALNKKEDHEIRKNNIENLMGKFDGKCSERAVNEILKILKN